MASDHTYKPEKEIQIKNKKPRKLVMAIFTKKGVNKPPSPHYPL